jgi:hypothetical protein
MIDFQSSANAEGSRCRPCHSPSPGGDLSRLGSGERNLAEPKVAWRPSERARASQRRDEGELFSGEAADSEPPTWFHHSARVWPHSGLPQVTCPTRSSRSYPANAGRAKRESELRPTPQKFKTQHSQFNTVFPIHQPILTPNQPLT